METGADRSIESSKSVIQHNTQRRRVINILKLCKGWVAVSPVSSASVAT